MLILHTMRLHRWQTLLDKRITPIPLTMKNPRTTEMSPQQKKIHYLPKVRPCIIPFSIKTPHHPQNPSRPPENPKNKNKKMFCSTVSNPLPLFSNKASSYMPPLRTINILKVSREKGGSFFAISH